MSDDQLLQEYAREGSHAAFAELVGRHRDWVHSAARRQLADDHLAEDVTQAVFLLLATKAQSMARHPNLGGWLFTTLRYCVKEAKRRQVRQQKREQEVAKMRPEAVEPVADWDQVAPVLDAAVASLGRQDRDAVLLRFYQQKPFAEVGGSLGVSEEAARKRVDRALEKLRGTLAGKGVVAGSAALGVAMTQRVTEAAPPQVANGIAHVVAGAGNGTYAGTIAQGVAKMARWAKVKALACAVIVLVLGALAVRALIADAGPAQTAASTTPPPASTPAAAPAPAPEYLGWVRVETAFPGSPRSTTTTTYLNTRTPTVVRTTRTANATYISYRSLATGLWHEYSSQTGQILIGEAITPEALSEVWLRPTGMAQVLARAKATLGALEVNIARSQDGDLQKLEITPAQAPNAAASSRIAAVTAWFDPTGRLRRYATKAASSGPLQPSKVAASSADEQYTYDEAGPADIYAAGAPRDAEVIDTRPDAATMAVLAKVRPIIRPVLTDHVAIWTQVPRGSESRDYGMMTITGRSGTKWFLREYEVLDGQRGQQLAKTQPQIITQAPSGWPQPKAADLLALTDGKLGRQTVIGEGSAAVQWKEESSNPNRYEQKTLAWVQRPLGPFPYAYPMDWQLFGPGPNIRLSLVTDEQHPGLQGIWIESVLSSQRRTTPTPSSWATTKPTIPLRQRDGDVLWVDPARGYLPALYERPVSGTPAGNAPPRAVTRYEQYATLPDGTLYPSVWSMEIPAEQIAQTMPPNMPAEKSESVSRLRIEPVVPDPKWFAKPTP